jgi:hypothetical protein
MGVGTNAGTRFYIGTALVVDMDQADDLVQAAMELDSWTEVGEMEDFGEIGDQAGEATFTAVGDRRVRKFKTTYNAGNMQAVVGDDSGDSGQQELIDAFLSDADYNFKIVYNDDPGAATGQTPSVDYFRGKVMSKVKRLGTVENVKRRTFNIGINSQIVEIAAADA